MVRALEDLSVITTNSLLELVTGDFWKLLSIYINVEDMLNTFQHDLNISL